MQTFLLSRRTVEQYFEADSPVSKEVEQYHVDISPKSIDVEQYFEIDSPVSKEVEQYYVDVSRK